MALSPKTAVRKIVTDDATVSALIGTRMFSGLAPQNTPTPYLEFGRVGEERYYHLGGHGGHSDADIQINCWDLTSDDVETLGEAVRDCLDCYRGTVTVSAASLVIRDTKLIADEDDYEIPEDGTDIGKYARVLTFRIFKEEPAPTP